MEQKNCILTVYVPERGRSAQRTGDRWVFACTCVRYMRLAGEWTGDDKVAIARTTDKENDTVFDTCSLKYEVCKRF